MVYAKNTVKAVRTKEHSNLINNSITKNLSKPLNAVNEEYWIDAFDAIELTTYRSAFVDSRVKLAFDSIEKRSPEFQRALLEMAYSNYKGKYTDVAEKLMLKTTEPKIFAMAAEHYLAAGTDPDAWNKVIRIFSKRSDKDKLDQGLFRQRKYGLADQQPATGLTRANPPAEFAAEEPRPARSCIGERPERELGDR